MREAQGQLPDGMCVRDGVLNLHLLSFFSFALLDEDIFAVRLIHFWKSLARSTPLASLNVLRRANGYKVFKRVKDPNSLQAG